MGSTISSAGTPVVNLTFASSRCFSVHFFGICRSICAVRLGFLFCTLSVNPCVEEDVEDKHAYI